MTNWTDGYIIYITGISIHKGRYTICFKKMDIKNITMCNGYYSDSYNTFINDEGYFVTANYHSDFNRKMNHYKIQK